MVGFSATVIPGAAQGHVVEQLITANNNSCVYEAFSAHTTIQTTKEAGGCTGWAFVSGQDQDGTYYSWDSDPDAVAHFTSDTDYSVHKRCGECSEVHISH